MTHPHRSSSVGNRFASWIAAGLLAGLLGASAGCSNSATTLHLLSRGDAVRVADDAAASSDWTAPAYGDDAWRRAATPLTTAASGALRIRQRFDVGADAAAWSALSLDVGGGRSWQAWLNGTSVGSGGGAGPVSLGMPGGLLHPSGNVLAIAIQADPGAEVTTQLTGSASASATPHVSLGPWLQSPTADGITVVFETSSAVPAQVVVDGKRFDAGGALHHEAVLTGLKPSSSYQYTVEANGLSTDAASFATAPAAGAPVTFVVWGDHRTNGDDHRRGAASVLAESPDFLIDTGDMVDGSTADEWRSFFAAEYDLLRQVPIMPAIGNHESDSGGGPRFRELFPIARASTSYSFDAGLAHVAILDSNGDVAVQAAWLDGDLSAATLRGQTALFVALHYGISSGTSSGHGVNDAVRSAVLPVLRAHQVVALFAGHDHFYERGVTDGVQYVVTGGGGAPLTTQYDSLDGSQKIVASLHHVVVRVAGQSVSLRSVGDDGTVIDEAPMR